MLIYKDEDIKIYQTNNLLLVLEGDKVEKQVYIEDKSLLEEEINEMKEKSMCLCTFLKNINITLAR